MLLSGQRYSELENIAIICQLLSLHQGSHSYHRKAVHNFLRWLVKDQVFLIDIKLFDLTRQSFDFDAETRVNG